MTGNNYSREHVITIAKQLQDYCKNCNDRCEDGNSLCPFYYIDNYGADCMIENPSLWVLGKKEMSVDGAANADSNE